MVEDGSLEALELIVRLEPEFLVQQPPARAVDLERVCLAAAAIEGQHQLAAQTFPQWLLAHEEPEVQVMLRERGGSSSFARHAFNELVAFIAGWAILIDYLIVVALAALWIALLLMGVGAGACVSGRRLARRGPP